MKERAKTSLIVKSFLKSIDEDPESIEIKARVDKVILEKSYVSQGKVLEDTKEWKDWTKFYYDKLKEFGQKLLNEGLTTSFDNIRNFYKSLRDMEKYSVKSCIEMTEYDKFFSYETSSTKGEKAGV